MYIIIFFYRNNPQPNQTSSNVRAFDRKTKDLRQFHHHKTRHLPMCFQVIYISFPFAWLKCVFRFPITSNYIILLCIFAIFISLVLKLSNVKSLSNNGSMGKSSIVWGIFQQTTFDDTRGSLTLIFLWSQRDSFEWRTHTAALFAAAKRFGAVPATHVELGFTGDIP